MWCMTFKLVKKTPKLEYYLLLKLVYAPRVMETRILKTPIPPDIFIPNEGSFRKYNKEVG